MPNVAKQVHKYLKPQEIKPYHNNPRRNDSAVGGVAESIQSFGFQQPILVDENHEILAGHTRWKAALSLELDKVPVVISSGLSDEQKKAYRIADNKFGEAAEWDFDKLALEFEGLNGMLDKVGFSQDEIDIIFTMAGGENGLTEDDSIPGSAKQRCNQGDLWELGEHHILCSDNLNDDAVMKMIGENQVSIAFNDPPYDIDIEQMLKAFKLCSKYTANSFWMGSDKQIVNLSANNLDKFSHFFVQDFRQATMVSASMPMSRHNIIAKFGKPKMNNLKDGFSTLLQIATQRTQKEHEKFSMGKNVALPEAFIRHYTKVGAVVMDLYLGYGSTLIACEKNDRKCFGVEISPHHCDLVLQRWEEYTGKKAYFLENVF